MAFKHGVYVEEVPTALVPPRPVESALPFVVGAAPVQSIAEAGDRKINEPVVVRSFEQFTEVFGEVPDGEAEADYSLSLFARIYFGLYGAQPAVFLNVFDPDTHVDATPEPDVTQVAAADVVGGIVGGARTGVEAVEDVFPTFGVVPAVIAAPGYSDDPAVAAAIVAKAALYGGTWRALPVVDVPDTEQTEAEVIAWKAANVPAGYACWPSVKAGAVTHPLSAHVLGLLAATDLANGGVPLESPSNKKLRGVTGATRALTDPEANALNAQGVATAVRFGTDGLVLWGNRLAAYPGSTDYKDSLVTARRLLIHIANQLVLSTRQDIDDPLNRKKVESLVEKTNIYLSGLVGQGALVDARVAVYDQDNPGTQLADGKLVFRVYYAPTAPAESITFRLEIDTESYASVLTA